MVQKLEDLLSEETGKVLLRVRQTAEYKRSADKARSVMNLTQRFVDKLSREVAEEETLILVSRMHASVTLLCNGMYAMLACKQPQTV